MSAVMRKPLPSAAPAAYHHTQAPYQQQEPRYTADRSHSRSRTASSTLMPQYSQAPAYTTTQQPQQPQYYHQQQHSQINSQPPPPASRRAPSIAPSIAASSTSSLNHAGQRTSTMSGYSTVSGVRRSTSSRSNSSQVSPTSYVALMRKQKATVWCDRAQHEDPRILAAQRQAKMRAVAEVAGGHNHAPPRTSTSNSGMVGGVRSKIRHHGAPKASAYSGANLSGAGVPMRLSASEVDENDSDEDSNSQRFHTRTGSGRSSLGSGRKGYSSSQLQYSNSSTPANHSPVGSMDDVLEEQTPMPGVGPEADDYFAHPGGRDGSGSSGEREENFGSMPGLPQQRGKLDPEAQVVKQKATADELRRRGSVDDRTMTMSAGRLFVANPDLSD